MSSKTREMRARMEELSILKNKLSEAESTLKEQTKLNNRLRADSERKIQRLNEAQEEIDTETERFRWKKDEFCSKMKSKEETYEVRLKEMRNRESDLLIAVSSGDVLQAQNEMLQNRLRTLSFEHSTIIQKMKEERELKSQKTFDMRMELDHILRQTLRAQRHVIAKESVVNMELEAANAKRENVRLTEEKNVREEKCIKLIRLQQKSYEKLTKLRVEREVTMNNTEMQEKSMKALEKLTQSQKLEVETLTSLITYLDNELDLLAQQLEYKKHQKAELELMEEKMRIAKAERQKVCKDTIHLAQSLVAKAMGILDQASAQPILTITDEEIAELDMTNGSRNGEQSLVSALEDATTADVTYRGDEASRVGRTSSSYDDQLAEKVWNSKLSESHIFSVHLRKLIRQQRQAAEAQAFSPFIESSMDIGGGNSMISYMAGPSISEDVQPSDGDLEGQEEQEQVVVEDGELL